MTELDTLLIGNDSKLNKKSMGVHEVHVQFEFVSLGEIDTMNERFHASIRIKSRWEIDEHTNAYDAKRHWNPKLFVENTNETKKKVSHKATSGTNGKKVLSFAVDAIVVLPYEHNAI